MHNAFDCGAEQIVGPLASVWFRSMTFEKAGDVVAGHSHNFDHVTFLWRGKLGVKLWPIAQPTVVEVLEITAPHRLLIKKDYAHELTALTSNTRADCIYALRDFDSQVTTSWNGDMTPYV